jgi:hypothetical protein
MKIKIILCLFCWSFALINLSVRAEEQEVQPLSDAELDQILAPIALYPDTILSHILIAATYPLEVVQAERWARDNADLKGNEALDAVEDEDWDPSVKALVPFSDLLSKMSEDLSWLQSLGEAFLEDEARLLDAVQKLRQIAYEEGNLEAMEHLQVSRENDEIVIEPASREVVYVPYYDTRYVYGNWWWNSHPPYYWTYRNHHYSRHNYWYWGPSVYISSRFYFSAPLWSTGHIVVVSPSYHRRHHFHSSYHVHRHRDARRWYHNPHHRRGVGYRTRDVSTRFNAVPQRSERRQHHASRERIVSGMRDRSRTSSQVERRQNRELRQVSRQQSPRDRLNNRVRSTAESRSRSESQARQSNANREQVRREVRRERNTDRVRGTIGNQPRIERQNRSSGENRSVRESRGSSNRSSSSSSSSRSESRQVRSVRPSSNQRSSGSSQRSSRQQRIERR